jgi:hypothetical protein
MGLGASKNNLTENCIKYERIINVYSTNNKGVHNMKKYFQFHYQMKASGLIHASANFTHNITDTSNC